MSAGALGDPPQVQVHLRGDVVRQPAQHGVGLLLGGHSVEQGRRSRGGDDPGEDRTDHLPQVAAEHGVEGASGDPVQPSRRARLRSRPAQRAQPGHGRLGAGPGRSGPGQRVPDADQGGKGDGGDPQGRGGGERQSGTGGETRVAEHVLHRRSHPWSVHLHARGQSPTERSAAQEGGQVDVQTASDVDHQGIGIGGVGGGPSPRPPAGPHPLEHGQAERGEGSEHALHVPDLHVEAGLVGQVLRGQGEEGGDGPGLEQPQGAVAVVGPLDVLRGSEERLEASPGRGQFEDLPPGEAALGQVGGASVVDRVVVGFDRAVHDRCARSANGVDHGPGPGPGERIGGEHDPGGGGVDHPLHHDRHAHARPVDAVGPPVGDGAFVVEGVPAAPDRVHDGVRALDVEVGVLLSGEAGVGQVLGGRAGAHRDPAPAQGRVGPGDPLGGHRSRGVRGGRDAEPGGHPLAGRRHRAEVGGLASHERARAPADLVQCDDVVLLAHAMSLPRAGVAHPGPAGQAACRTSSRTCSGNS